MSRKIRPRERGSSIVEMSLVFVLLMFSVLSIFELGRAMWTYHTLATSVKKAVRVAMVHGARCAEASETCQVSLGDLVRVIQQVGVGLDMSLLQLTFTASGSSSTCAPASNCLANDTKWPAAPYNPVGQNVTINGTYAFNNVLTVLWPGQTVSRFTLSAKSTETIQF